MLSANVYTLVADLIESERIAVGVHRVARLNVAQTIRKYETRLLIARVTFFARSAMCDIKDVLPTLCKYINSLINIGLTSEHLRLAKYNAPNKIVVSISIGDSNVFALT